MDKIDVIKIDRSNLPSLLKIAELQVQNTIKINGLVKWANDVDIVINHLGIVEGDIITRIELLENATKTD